MHQSLSRIYSMESYKPRRTLSHSLEENLMKCLDTGLGFSSSQSRHLWFRAELLALCPSAGWRPCSEFETRVCFWNDASERGSCYSWVACLITLCLAMTVVCSGTESEPLAEQLFYMESPLIFFDISEDSNLGNNFSVPCKTCPLVTRKCWFFL